MISRKVKNPKTFLVICLSLISVFVLANPASTDVSDISKPLINSVATNVVKKDSIQIKDSVAVPLKKPKAQIKEIVEYEARDSLSLNMGGTAELYGEGKVSYGEVNLTADEIKMNMDSSVVHANGVKDSSGVVVGEPVFENKGTQYNAKKIDYNFDSEKGIISNVVTQQGEGYVVSGRTKKNANGEMCMVNGKYTTCDKHDDPHFYLALSKAKVKPGHYVVSGPAHLVVEDVHIPLYLPWGFFPFSKSYSSGIISPSYGDEMSRGFYLRDFGYYFAFNDYLDLALTGQIYTKGSWGLAAASSYKKRYKYSGRFNASYLVTVTGEKYLPDYSKQNSFSLSWSHSQDAKANPYRTFSASVDFQTSGYSHNNIQDYYDAERFSSSTRSSSVNITQKFPNSPFTINLSANVSESSRDTTISMTFPNLRISMSSLAPFARKNRAGDQKWYEKIRMSYSGTFSNKINNVKEYDFFKQNIVRDWRNGAMHSIPVSATFNAFNFLNISPSLSYTERWATSELSKKYDTNANEVVTDTTWGFHRVWDYSTSLSANTKIYGMYKPWSKLFGNKVSMIRHVITPTVSLSYHPDFGSSKYGYYDSYNYYDDNELKTVKYSKFANSLYGAPGSGESGSVSFSVSNNLEMKVREETDTALVYKKVSLIDNFSFGSSYNMMADSLNWSNISVNLRLKFGKKYSLNLGGALDPYTYNVDGNNNVYKTNTTEWKKNRIPGRLISTGTSFSYTLSNETFKKKERKKDNDKGKKDKLDINQSESNYNSGDEKEPKPLDKEAALYEPFKLPWSISTSYSLRYSRSDFDYEKLKYNHKFTHNLSFSGRISLTPKWNFNASTNYNFTEHEISSMTCSFTRDLHCWEMSGSFIPIGYYKSYNVTIRVKASALSDLKYEQHSNPLDNIIWGK